MRYIYAIYIFKYQCQSTFLCPPSLVAVPIRLSISLPWQYLTNISWKRLRNGTRSSISYSFSPIFSSLSGVGVHTSYSFIFLCISFFFLFFFLLLLTAMTDPHCIFIFVLFIYLVVYLYIHSSIRPSVRPFLRPIIHLSISLALNTGTSVMQRNRSKQRMV